MPRTRVKFLSGPSSPGEGRYWPSPPTSAKQQEIPPLTPSSSPSAGHPPPSEAGDLQAAPSTPPWNHALCAPAPPTPAVSPAWSTRPPIPKPDTPVPCITPPQIPASIIRFESKADSWQREQPPCSATSSTTVAGDPKRPRKPHSPRASNILYNVPELEVNS